MNRNFEPRHIRNIAFATALGLAAVSCKAEPPLGNSIVTPIPETTTHTFSKDCDPTPPESLRPPFLNRQAVLLYPGGWVVNFASGMEMVINERALQEINTSSKYGVNLKPDEVNGAFFFPNSARTEAQKQQAYQMMSDSLYYLLIRICQEQNITVGNVLLDPISVEDSIRTAMQLSTLTPKDEQFKSILSQGFAQQYTVGVLQTHNHITNPNSVGPNTLAPDVAKAVFNLNPFSVAKLSDNYLRSLGIS